MNRFVVGAMALAAVGSATAAQAADLGYAPRSAYTVNQPLNAYSWAGPYLGGTLGYEWGNVGNNPTKPSGITGGIEAGYNWQNGPFVFGVEGDINLTGADDTFAPWKFSNPWFGTLRGRAGYAMNNILLYGTVGLAYGTIRAQSLALGIEESRTTYGWAAGAGLEVALSGNWSAKAEYLYIDLNDRSFALTGTEHGLTSSVLRFGVNYRF
jgi:outer membrane immunogenic protein